MGTLWDEHYSGEMLEEWLYGPSSLGGATRRWFVDRAAQWPPGTRLLDAGCGGGVTGYQLLGAGLLDRLTYVGADFSQNMLDLAERKVVHPNASFAKRSLTELGYDREFDRILLRAVLAHVREPGPVIDNVARALRVAGELYVIFWNNPVEGEPVLKQVKGGFWDNGHNEAHLRECVTQAGLELVETHSIPEPSARQQDHRVVWVLQRAA